MKLEASMGVGHILVVSRPPSSEWVTSTSPWSETSLIYPSNGGDLLEKWSEMCTRGTCDFDR